VGADGKEFITETRSPQSLSFAIFDSSDIREQVKVFVVLVPSAFSLTELFSDSMNAMRSIHLTIL